MNFLKVNIKIIKQYIFKKKHIRTYTRKSVGKCDKNYKKWWKKSCQIENKIIEDLMWHGARVYNTLLHELREVRRKIDKEKSINMIQIAIYKEYREDNWHSEYLHSHTL